MPSLDDALRFVKDPATATAQLRRACRILALDDSGPEDELRARLLELLCKRDEGESVVCLNPRIDLTGEPPAGESGD